MYLGLHYLVASSIGRDQWWLMILWNLKCSSITCYHWVVSESNSNIYPTSNVTSKFARFECNWFQCSYDFIIIFKIAAMALQICLRLNGLVTDGTLSRRSNCICIICIGLILRWNSATCKFQLCYLYCQIILLANSISYNYLCIPVLANSVLLSLLLNSVILANSTPFIVKFHYLQIQLPRQNELDFDVHLFL